MSHIATIAAVGLNDELGYKNQLLCHLPNDLKRFKELTSGHTILMGHRTWDSLPIRPLPKRRNLVLSRDPQLQLEGAEVFPSFEKALATLPPDETLFVIGGATLYASLMEHSDTLYITRILSTFEADVYFPTISTDLWELQSDIFVPRDEKNPHDCHFMVYHRRTDKCSNVNS